MYRVKKIVLLVFLLAAPELSAATETSPVAQTCSSAEGIAAEVTVTGKKGDLLQRVNSKESELLNPSQMSVYKAINLFPSLSQQSVDPYGLADIVNYHESFRFRGIEATSGGVPATTVNVEGLPLTGRPGGGATIYDLENFSTIEIYSGVMPANAGLGLADVGGKINIEIRRPEDTFGVLLKQSTGSGNFYRTFMRVDSGALPGRIKSFISFSSSEADKWKGEGSSQRTNLMAGVTKEFSDRVKLETFVTWSKGDIHAYKPFSYANISSSYTLDYGSDPNKYDFYDYNRNEFEDLMVMANLAIKTGENSRLNIKPYYWSDKGYYLETITIADKVNPNRIRRWDIDHDLKGIMAEYTTRVEGIDLDLGYLYHTQERPGPPSSWKNYKVINGQLVFDTWSILSNSSSHELHSPFLDAKYRFGHYLLEAGVKFVNYTLPSIITYTTAGIGDVSYDEALSAASVIDTDASALETKSFSRLFPNLTLTREVGSNATIHAAYGENYVTHVDIYPYFISQMSLFKAKGITFQQLWDRRQMETSQNFELGMKLNGSKWSIAPTIYYALHNKKQAVLYDAALDATYPINNADAQGYGCELEAAYKPSDALSCYGSLSWNRFSFSQDINSDAPGSNIIHVKGVQVPDAPEFLAKGMVSCKTGNLMITPIVRYTSVRYGDVLHNEKIDAATLFDLDLTWSRKMLGFKTIDCSLSFLNVFDKKYVSMISTSDYKTLKTSYQPGAPFTVIGTIAFHY